MLTIFAAANWRGAFEESGFLGDGFRGEMQIVGAGLDGDRETFGAGGAQIGEGLAG